jgi:hypothetical protein
VPNTVQIVENCRDHAGDVHRIFEESRIFKPNHGAKLPKLQARRTEQQDQATEKPKQRAKRLKGKLESQKSTLVNQKCLLEN